MEGVMMRGKRGMATAVRDGEGVIRLEAKRLTPPEKKPWILKVPIIRGAVSFFESLIFGTKILMRSAEVYGEEESEPSKFEKWLSKTFKLDIMDVIIWLGVILGLGFSILLFILLPQIITDIFAKWFTLNKTGIIYNLIEGGIRILIFVSYILLTSLLKDIKRTYMYHGAEHKTITCYEKGLPLTVENVKKCRRVHDRCGTTFMFFVMIVSILVFSIANTFIGATGVLRMLIKIAFLPLVAGLSYELLKGLSKTESKLVLPLKAPGLLLQRITTKEPDDDMIEVAIKAFSKALKMDEDENEPECEFVLPKKLSEVLKEVKEVFAKNGIDESDAEWLISIVANVSRSDLNKEKTLTASQIEKINSYAKERLTKRPLWYILGTADFYGYEFNVDERVLIPRPETEELVSLALNFITENSKVLDLCTGSGAIAITVKKKTGASVYASDISDDALKVASDNALKLNAEIKFIKSDLFENISDKFDVIISNPPYIKSGDISSLDDEVKSFEPMLALDGGEDGLFVYRRISDGIGDKLTSGGILFLELGIDQAESVKKMFEKEFDVEIIKDINGIERILKAVKK